MKNVTFDFDGTLQRPDVQGFVKELMLLPDVAVGVVTARDNIRFQCFRPIPESK